VAERYPASIQAPRSDLKPLFSLRNTTDERISCPELRNSEALGEIVAEVAGDSLRCANAR